MPLADAITTRVTCQEYCSWDDDQRWELIDGQAWSMSPAPGFKHQQLAGALYALLWGQLKGKRCLAGIAHTDIVLSDYDVVQPDVFVVCDRNKVTNQSIKGAPEIVIEVLSPSTSLKDRREKKRLYEKFGVQEYLLVDPVGQVVERFCLQDDGGWDKGEVFGPDQIITFHFLPDVHVDLREVFVSDAIEETKAPPVPPSVGA